MHLKCFLVYGDDMTHLREDWFNDNHVNIGKSYEQKVVKDHPYFVFVKTQEFLHAAEKHIGTLQYKTCLDIGCGTAETTAFLSKKFGSVAGIDYSFDMLIYGKKKIYTNTTAFFQGSGTQLPFKEESFDAIVLFNMLHHIGSTIEMTAMMNELYKTLKKQGFVAVIELNPYNPITRHIVKTNEIDKAITLDGFKKEKFPTTLYAEESIQLLQNAGFISFKIIYFIYFPKVLRLFYSLEKYFHSVPLGGLYMVTATK